MSQPTHAAALPPLPPAVLRLIDLALDEDLGRGDLTSEAIFSDYAIASGTLLAKARSVCRVSMSRSACLPASMVAFTASRCIAMSSLLLPGTAIMRVEGPVRGLLAAERTVLNFCSACRALPPRPASMSMRWPAPRPAWSIPARPSPAFVSRQAGGAAQQRQQPPR